ncbi:hypothetical protein M758_1G002500 [Ceratodon purpureus]|uniref:Transcription initiation factor IIF subunit beta n=1 Tax=Ceratodon purpureus TaxID=3225 RepID=A0A8T0J2A3_CERPU|nr:hypothetical protein KC19_1G004100 [Ceratodon purpureus]KAG0628122.1 hypothetical protein M758_1G002500 [Ceratodon purpureus]
MAGTAKEEKDGEFGGPGGMHMLDTGTSERSVWLLKVPPLVGNSWLKQQDGGPSLAKVTMSIDPLNPNGTDGVEFTLTLPEKDLVAPHKSYSLNVTKDLVPMHIFSETTQGKLRVEGKVEHKFDMKPSNIGNNDEYRKLCRDRLNKSMVKTRTTQVLSNDRGGFMRPPPIDAWPQSTFTGKDNKKKAPITNTVKQPEGKRIRRDRGELEAIVFKLFERRPNWALKQLVEETDQPVAFLKEVLNDLCIYNKRGANQGTYELKPEYRRNEKEEDVKPAT